MRSSVPGHRPPGREQQVGPAVQRAAVVVGQQVGQDRARLRHAVGLDEVALERRHRAPQRGLGDRRGAVGDESQVRIGARGGVRDGHQAGLDHRRHQRGPPDPVLGERADDLGRVEVAVDDHAATAVDRGERGDGAGGVVHRHHQEPSLAVVRLDGQRELREVRGDRAMGEQRALGPARGAARVHLVEHVVVADDPRRHRRGGGVQPRRPADPAGARLVERHELLDATEVRAQAVHRRGVLAGHDQQARAGVGDDPRPLRRRQPVVQRHRHHAGLGGGVVEHDVLHAVLGEDGDAVTDREAGGHEGGGDPVGERARLGVGQAAAVLDGEVRPPTLPRVVVERIVQPHRSAGGVEEVAAHLAPERRAQRRHVLRAARHHLRAARVEAAAGRRVDRARHLAGQDDLLAHLVGMRGQRGREQRLRVGVLRIGGDRLGRRRSRRSGRGTSPRCCGSCARPRPGRGR